MKHTKVWVIGYVIALALTLLSPFASKSPDGLDTVAQQHQFADKAQGSPFQVIADYAFPGVENEALATVLAGMLGVTVVYALVAGTAFLMYRRVESRTHQSAA